MKPTKTHLFRNTSMLALFISSVVFITSCKKDTSVESTTPVDEVTTIDSVSGERIRGQRPIIKTGPDQTLTLPTNSTTLDGSGSYDPDGSIRYWLWTKEIGNGGTLGSPNAAKTSLTGLTAGIYRFRLKITDNSGNSISDTIRVTVNGTTSTTNQAPVVTVGPAQTITLPTSSVTLTGSATDADGTIASYLWTKVSGSTAVITSPSSASTTVTGLLAGSYTFNLKATDNAGASSNKTVSVTVNSATTTPPPTGYTLTFSSNYDVMADMLYGGNGQYANGTISTTVYKTGPGSFYSRPADVSNGTRSEVQYTEAAQNPIEGAIEYDVMYEVIVPNNGCSIQWHPYTSGSSGSPYLMHDGGKFTWVVWKAGGNTYYPTNFTIQTQKWYHMRMEHKFGTSGYWRHYIDGVLVASWTGNVGDGSGQYLKVGYNGWDPNSSSSRIYYDNLRIWKKG